MAEPTPNVSRDGDVRTGPSGFREVLRVHPKTGRARWNQENEDTAPGQVLHYGFAKDQSSLSDSQLEEVRSQAEQRGKQENRVVSVNNPARAAETDAPTSEKKPKANLKTLYEQTIQQNVEHKARTNKPLLGGNDIAHIAASHLQGMNQHLDTMVAQLKDVDASDPRVIRANAAREHLGAAEHLLNEYHKNNVVRNQKQEITVGGEGPGAGEKRLVPVQNRAEAEDALHLSTVALAGAHALMHTGALKELGTKTPSSVRAESVVANQAHAAYYQSVGFVRNRGKEKGSFGLTSDNPRIGTLHFKNTDPGVRNAIQRIKDGIAAGDPKYSGITMSNVNRLTGGNTERLTTAEKRQIGLGPNPLAYAERRVESTGDEGVPGQPFSGGGSRPSRPGDTLEPEAPRSPRARPVERPATPVVAERGQAAADRVAADQGESQSRTGGFHAAREAARQERLDARTPTEEQQARAKSDADAKAAALAQEIQSAKDKAARKRTRGPSTVSKADKTRLNRVIKKNRGK